MDGSSRAQKVILGQRLRKLQNSRACKEKGLIKCEARGHIGHKAGETQEQVRHEARDAREQVWHEACGARKRVGHEARETEST